MVICLLSCSSENKSNNDMELLLKSYSTDRLSIQDLIGEDMFYFHSSYKINNGKLIACGMRNSERTSDSYNSLLFAIDLENKQLLSTVTDPVKDYVDLTFNLWDDSTLVVMHSLKNEEVYLINIYNHEVDKRYIQFDESANRPATIDVNGKQLFMIQNVYGFAVADLNTLKGKVFANSSFSTFKSTVSYPIDKELNLLSGTFEYDPKFSENHRESITIYAIDAASKVKWKKALSFIKYDDLDAFNFYNYASCFIIKYHNTVECLDKKNGRLVWHFTNEHPITQTFMVGNKLVVHSSSAGNVIPSENESEMKKIKETNYREEFKIIDLESGKVLWNKNLSGTNSEVGIIGGNLIVYNDKNAFILNLEKMQQHSMKQTMDLNQSSFKNIMDSKTGKLYLEYNGMLYW